MSKSKGFTKAHLTDKLFQHILNGANNQAKLKTWSFLNAIKQTGYISDVVENKDGGNRILGLFPFQLEYTLPNTEQVFIMKVMIKSKCTSQEMYQSIRKFIPESDGLLLKLFDKYVSLMEIGNFEHKELECVQLDDEILKSLMPKIYWYKKDSDQDIFVFAMEYLEPESVSHFNSINKIYLWQEDDIEIALDGIALLHSRYYERIADLPSTIRKYTDISYRNRINDLVPLWKMFLDKNLELGVWDKKQFELGNRIICNLPEICDILDKAPKTLIHNDASLMNLCLRKDTPPGQPRVCLYDWELCYIGVPQEDAAIFLIFVLPEDVSVEKWHFYLRKYYSSLLKYLENYQNREMNLEASNSDEFQKVFDMSMCVRYMNRFNWAGATLVPTVEIDFYPRIMKNAADYLSHVMEKYNFV